MHTYNLSSPIKQKQTQKVKKTHTLVKYVTNKDDNDLIGIITYMIIYYVCYEFIMLYMSITAKL